MKVWIITREDPDPEVKGVWIAQHLAQIRALALAHEYVEGVKKHSPQIKKLRIIEEPDEVRVEGSQYRDQHKEPIWDVLARYEIAEHEVEGCAVEALAALACQKSEPEPSIGGVSADEPR